MKKKRKVRKLKIKSLIIAACSFFLFFASFSAYLKSYSEFVTNVSRETSGVRNNTVYVNDAESDYYYYTGMNYTYTADKTIPNLNDKNYYNTSNLVEINITYSGTDIVETSWTGTVSNTESANKYVYYRVLPVNNNNTSNTNDDYVLIELIDNPFANRPNNYGFNGWVTSYAGAEIYLDTTYYIRYAKVPITYSNNKPNVINITFNAKWVDSPVVRLNTYTSWASAFDQLDDEAFVSMGYTVVEYEDLSGYYVYHDSLSGYYYPSNAVNSRGQDIGDTFCFWNCTYYTPYDGEQGLTVVYELRNNNMQAHTPQIINTQEFSGVRDNSNIAGYYKKRHLNRNESATNLYDNNGDYVSSVTCNTNGGCDYYELQQYYNSLGQPNIHDNTNSLYYKVTRDTNIIILDRNMTSTWGSSQDLPFTLTGLYNGALTNNYLNINGSGVNINAYNDTRIEHIQLSTQQGFSTNNPSTSNSRRYIYANFHNLKIGRGIRQNGNYVNAYAVIGGSTGNSNQGSSGSPKRFKMYVESGVYNFISASQGYGSTSTVYQNGIVVAGNDYDRVDNHNDRLTVYENINGTYGGKYNEDSNGDYLFDVTFKCGQVGTSRDAYSTGIYIGGWGTSNDTINGTMRLKIEGGWSYNVIGGPLVTQANRAKNVVNLYMTGGEVEGIFGGAGDAATYGNRILQITGGTVNFSVFGGSNGYQSDEGKGTLNGDTYIYIGGNATIGKQSNVDDQNARFFGSEAGSVFGIGNGKTGSSTIGSCDNSNIIINDNAKIKKNVYGGGNWGATGVSSTTNTSNTRIKMLGGTVSGSIYGGGNNNGSGSSSKSSTINISVEKGTITGSVYGGSKALGRVYGNTNVTILGGTMTNVYGGGEGGYTDNNNYGTFVSGNVNVIIGDSSSSSTPSIAKVYGGSAFGTVNGTSNTTTLQSGTTKVTVNKGTITSVFGGGEGDNTYTPYVEGNIEVRINGGTITDVYGANDQKGTPNGEAVVYIAGGTVSSTYGGGNLAPVKTSKVYLNGGTSTNVYGGGNLANATTTNVYLQGGNTTTIYGGSNQSGTVTTSNVTTTNGTATTVYGGNNLGGVTTTSNVTIGGATLTTVYGGGNVASTGTTHVNINNGTVPNVYAGGNEAGVSVSTNTIVNGGTVTNLFGGSNTSGEVTASYITTNSGNITTMYGGNNLGGSTNTSNITANGGTITTIYGGGNKAETATTNIELKGANSTNVYGGGNEAGITNQTNVNLNGSGVGTIYGGSNTSGEVVKSVVTLTNGAATTVYGGNNLGGLTQESFINVNGAYAQTIYGGGNVATTTKTNVNLNSSNAGTVYGGGNQAGVTDSTNINQSGTNVTTIYGGSNQSGTVTVSNIITTGGITNTIYGGNNQGGTTTTTNITVNNGSITDIFGGGNQADSTTTNININNSNGAITNIYGGGNQASVATTNVNLNGNNTITNVFGGSNMSGIVNESNVSIPIAGSTTNVTNLFGGNNRGGKTKDANIDIKSGRIGSIYGGGNYAETDSTNTSIKGATVTGTIYGGGNQAGVVNDSILKLDGSNVTGNVFGGGNLGTIGGNTEVLVVDSIIRNNLFAGGNGTTAIVHGNTLLNVGGNTSVNHHVFGGGNAAATGTQDANNSTSLVNIAGLTCGGNVYGGANTSVLYGIANVNIGKNVVTDSTLKKGNIHISGTVFGGGEANAAGSEIYDFSFISVTTGININIDASSHSTFDIDGSIFGSGNASSTSGYSNVYIKNYGTESNYKTNVSIQRAQNVTLDNSVIELVGATDRTNEYSDVLFSLSRLDEIKLLNNSVLYLQNGTNLVKKFTSGKKTGNTETKATVTIDDGDVTRNVNNKLYIYEGRNINIATNENITAYGEVSGMTFFGMFDYDRNGKVYTALYNTNYDDDSTVPSSEIVHFTKGSYVLGRHVTNHNYEQDGFYTNYPDQNETDKINVKYIRPTPEDADYYMWAVGDQVTSIDITLTASKYSTLGTYELPLINFSEANTTFSVLGFNYNEMSSDAELVEKDLIPRIADTHEEADNRMSLVMKSSDIGWITNGKTTFLTDESYFSGTTNYISENSNTVPTLLFYLYHSKNLETAGDLGTATISLVAIVPIDDLNNEIKRININVNINRAIYTTDDYEGTITTGKVYEMFAPGVVNITTKSAFTTYYSLFVEKNESIYKPGYHRVLSSTYNFPANTKITMIDLLSGTSPEYYYYVVSNADYVANQAELQHNGDVAYPLSKFIRMGSDNPNNHYDDVAKNILYWDDDRGIAEEEFIFIVDFKEAGINEDVLEKYLLLELRSSDDEIIMSVIGVLQQQLFYNLYANKDSVINVDGTLSTTEVYIGEAVQLHVATNFVQPRAGSNSVIDTNFYDYRSGIKLSILDSNDNVVTGPNIMGISYTLGNTTYYPRFDGTVRINVAERIANVSSNITINTEGSNLASGNYKLLIESFGSPDGIYYGLVPSDSVELPFTVKNTRYGLKATVDSKQLIVKKDTGVTEDGTNAIAFNFQYSSALLNPNIRVSLYRRDYDDVYSDVYHLVDFKDYFTNNLSTTNVDKLYMLFDDPQSTMSSVFYFKNNLKSGTYKIVFSLYDNNTYIGDVFKYIIIK